MNSRDYEQYLKEFTSKQRKMVQNSTISVAARITEVYPNGFYKVTRLDDNKVIDRICSEVPAFKWREGQYVTVESNGVTWSIVGRSPVSGGEKESL